MHSLYIRPVMFATDPVPGCYRHQKPIKFIVLTCPVGPYFSKPLRVKFETHYTRAAEGGFGYAKAAGNYGGSRCCHLKRRPKKVLTRLIWTDAKEHLYAEEMGAANVMFVLDGKLITPSTRDTILDGVTRDTVLALARIGVCRLKNAAYLLPKLLRVPNRVN
jgi:branched-chain amino acid aminotransferase